MSRGRFPLPGAQPARRRSPTGPRQPGSPHGIGPGYRCPPWNRQLVGRAALRAGEAVPDGAQLPPAAARRRTGDRQLPPTTCETQRQLKRRRHGAAPRSRRSALRGVFPLSAAQHGPRHSMQRATAGQDKGVLAGSYRERRYCSIAKRLSPAARSLPSPPLACCPLPPAPPPPAAAAAADSRRRPPPGRAGSASSLRDRSTALRPARPAPLRHSPAHGAGSPGRPPARPARATRGSRLAQPSAAPGGRREGEPGLSWLAGPRA